MGGNIPGENFLCGNFPGEVFHWEIFRVGFPEPLSSYNASILIFQKIINEYNKTFSKKIYSLNSKCRSKFLSRNF